MKRLCNQRIVWCVLCGMLLSSGCGGEDSNLPKTAPVKGTVSYQGEPVTLGQILFIPENGERSGIGRVQEDGTFTVTTYSDGDGAVVGKNKVTISAYDNNLVNQVPGWYENANTTPLTLEVQPETDNEFEIVLEGEASSQPALPTGQ